MSETAIEDTDTEEFKVVEGGATIDKPIRGLIKNNDISKVQELDTLKTFDYAKALAEHGKYHAGVVLKNSGQFECTSLLGAGSNIKQHKDQDAFEVLVVKS